MALEEKERGAFKQWMLPKLEAISDDVGDAEVLADPVLDLIIAAGQNVNVKRDVVDLLSEYLQERAEPFVGEILRALESQSWISEAKVNVRNGQIPSVAVAAALNDASRSNAMKTQENTVPREEVNRSYGNNSGLRNASHPHFLPSISNKAPPTTSQGSDSGHIQNGSGQYSKKRKSEAAENGQSNHGGFGSSAGRPLKQRSRAARDRWRPSKGQITLPVPHELSLPSAPASAPIISPMCPPGTLPFIPGDMTPLLFAVASGFGLGFDFNGLNLPSMNAIPPAVSNAAFVGVKCEEYTTSGFCRMGTSCPYEHTSHSSSGAALEYDPNNASLGLRSFDTVQGRSLQGGNQSASIGGSITNREVPRAPFSEVGPSKNPTNVTLVVERIPIHHCSEESVRGFFSQFGEVEEVDMSIPDRLAIVTFADRATAERAYSSPKVIFDNRFVKVYWYKEDSTPSNGNNENTDHDMSGCQDEEGYTFDWEAFKKRQAEAQEAYEKRKELNAKARLLAEQVEMKESDIRVLRRKCAELARAMGEESLMNMSEEHADAWLGDLSLFQAEANDSFTRHEQDSPMSRGRRDFGNQSWGHSLSGRGGGFTYCGPKHGRSSVMRLDNRSRRLAIAHVERGSKMDEAVRHLLLNFDGCNSIDWHSEQPHTLVVGFQCRWQAEKFIDNARIPGGAKLELSWVPNTLSVVHQSTKKPPTSLCSLSSVDVDVSSTDMDERSSMATIKEEEDDQCNVVNPDLDVADDQDKWLGSDVLH